MYFTDEGECITNVESGQSAPEDFGSPEDGDKVVYFSNGCISADSGKNDTDTDVSDEKSKEEKTTEEKPVEEGGKKIFFLLLNLKMLYRKIRKTNHGKIRNYRGGRTIYN